MAQSSEIKLLKRFDQNVEITGTLTVGGASVITTIPSEYLTQAEGDNRYIQSIPSEYLTQTEGDARYLQTLPSHTHNILKEAGSISYGTPGLQWFDINGGGGTGVNGGVPNNPYSEWWHHLVMNHANSNGYYVDMAFCFHTDDVYFRRNAGNSFGTWREFIHSGNIGGQSVSYASNAGTLDNLDSTEFARGRAAYQQLNFDAIKQPGLYQYDNIAVGGGTAPPDPSPYNFRTIEIGSENRYSQIALGYNTDSMYFRRHTGSWSAWKTVIHDGNIGSQSVTFSTTAANNRFGNILVGEGTYKNTITPIDDTNLNINTPSGAVYFNTYTIASGSHRAPIFYDSNDTSYFTDPASTSWSAYGAGGGRFRNIEISPSTAADTIQNVTSGGNLWLQYNHNGTTGIGYGGGNTTIYSGLTVNNGIDIDSGNLNLDSGYITLHKGHADTRLQLEYEHSSDGGDAQILLWASEPGVSFYGSGIGANINFSGHYYGRRTDALTYGLYMRFDPNNGSTYFGDTTGTAGSSGGQGNTNFQIDAVGNTFSLGSSRSPIFYDYNDTTYYIDPNSTGTSARLNGDIYMTGGKIHVKRGTGLTTTIIDDDSTANGRGQLLLDSSYSDLIIASRQANANRHGSTLTFATQSTTDNNYRKWVIGQGQYQEGADHLTFAFGQNATNPHDILGTDNANYSFQIHDGGHTYNAGSSRAPIFYDIGNTAYYINADATSNLYNLELSGAKHTYLYITPGNGYEAMVRFNGGSGSTWYVGSRTSTQLVGSTDAWHVYSQTRGATVSGTDNEGNTFARSSSRAPIFYDSDNTAYYLNPASFSQLNTAKFGTTGSSWGSAYIATDSGSSWGNSVLPYIGSTGGSTGSLIMLHNPHIAFRTENGRSGASGRAGIRCAVDTNASSWWDIGLYGDAFELYRSASNQQMFHVDNARNSYSWGSSRAPIFYDSSNTGYYVDPASTSNLSGLTVAAQITGSVSGSSNSLASTGYGNGNFTWRQDSGSFNVFSGWHNYLISNHGNGSNYYNTIIAMPFWGPPRYSRLEGGTQRGPYEFWTSERDISSSANISAPMFYDYNNTGYYCDPASTSYMYVNDFPHIGNGNYNIRVNNGGQENWRAIHVKGGVNDHIGIGYHGSSRSQFGVDGVSIHFDEDDSFRLHTDGWDTEFEVRGGGTAWLKGEFRAGGDVIAYYSDERLKTKTGSVENALDKVKSLSAFYYKHNDKAKEFGFKGDNIELGLSAQEVQKVIPEVIRRAPFDTIENEAGDVMSKTGEDYLTLKYDRLVPLLIESIKELSNKVEELENKLNGTK